VLSCITSRLPDRDMCLIGVEAAEPLLLTSIIT